MHQARLRLLAVAMIIALVGLFATGGTRSIRAQDATPGTGEDMGAAGAHPAHIHTGTCAELGDVVFPLADVGSMAVGGSPATPEGEMGTPAAAGEAMGAASAVPIEMSVTVVEAALSDIVAGGHAINVHESAENIGNYIACGDIGGAMVGTDLVLGLVEQNDSGYSGVAWLRDNGDGTTTVTIFLGEGLSGAGMAPEGDATPSA